MEWEVRFHPAFEREFVKLPETVQDEVFAYAKLLEVVGPQLKRPYADTLSGSKHANMKELRINVDDGTWRVAFAFDPTRKGILLDAGDKSGKPENRFYRRLIAKADRRLDAHLAQLSNKENR